MSVVLNNLLKRLEPFLQTPNLEELFICRPQEIRIRFAGQQEKERIEEEPELTLEYWDRLCYVLSNLGKVFYNPEIQPKVSTILPGGHRFEGTIGNKIKESKLSIAIRVKRNVQVSLAAFGLPEFLQEKIIKAIEIGDNLIVSGGTGSGKTTFLNSLITHVPLHQRIITVEDTDELVVPHANRIGFLLDRNEKNPDYGYNEAINQAMRKTPDRLIVGELSVENTFPSIRLLQSGHKGYLTSIHSDSCRSALEDTMPMNVTLSGNPAQGIAELLKQKVDWVVQVNKVEVGSGVKRQVTEVWQPQTGYTWHWQKGEGYAA